MDEQRYPNQAANQEQAEGSRETAGVDDEQAREQRERFDKGDTHAGERDEHAGGITNRALEDETASQREVPPRGDVKAPGRDDA